ncbi:MAG: hypothetical protein IH870_04795 [Chloroflexi bacterium]|nr:hypothetical protein [Chloroflexota bacterium]
MFAKEIKQFADNLAALREFVEVLNPLLEMRQKEVVEEAAPTLMPLVLVLNALEPDSFPVGEELKETIRKESGFLIEVNEAEEGTRSVTLSLPNETGQEFVSAMRRFRRTIYHPKLLYQNALVALVSSGEWFLSQLLHAEFNQFPDSAGVEERPLKLKELQEFASIDEARQYLIDLRVEEILRGSFDDWMLFFKSHFKLEMGYVNNSVGQLVEICQRRNLIIHNGGYVNEIYLSKVAKEFQCESPLGTSVEVSVEYLSDAIAYFEKAFVLIAAELWKNRSPTDENRSGTLLDLIYDHLLNARWDIAKTLSQFVIRDKRVLEKHQLIGQVNYWQCLKWQGRFEEIQQEIESTDFSAKDKQFRLAQRALLDDATGFFEMVPSLLQDETITEQALQEWPLFKNMRETEEYQEFMAAKTQATPLS